MSDEDDLPPRCSRCGRFMKGFTPYDVDDHWEYRCTNTEHKETS